MKGELAFPIGKYFDGALGEAIVFNKNSKP